MPDTALHLEHAQPFTIRQSMHRVLAFRGPGRGFVVAADEQVAADELLLRAGLAVGARDAVDAVVAHRLLLARRVRAALLLQARIHTAQHPQ